MATFKEALTTSLTNFAKSIAKTYPKTANIVDNLLSTDSTLPLSAKQGNVLQKQIDTLNSNKVSVSVASGATVSTGINVNAGSRGKTYLVMASGNSNTGNASVSEIGMIRCGYDGNNYSYTNIAFSGGTSIANAFLQFSVKDGILYVGANFAVTMRVTFIVN